MPERLDRLLRAACLGLVVVIFAEAVLALLRPDPLRGVKIPEVPTLPPSPEATAAGPGARVAGGMVGPGMTSPGLASGATQGRLSTTGAPMPMVTGTNRGATGAATNLAVATTNSKGEHGKVNQKAGPESGSPGSQLETKRTTNAPTRASGSTNRLSNVAAAPARGSSTTNAASRGEGPVAGSSRTAAAPGVGGTNRAMARGPGASAPMGMGRPGMPGPELPAALRARVERVVQSEILGAVPRPLPMALLGIAGPDVFLRAPNGQTGLLREGKELGGVKLVQIGTNRVLVDEGGELKELMIFNGIGGESLLPKGKDHSQ